MSTRLQIASPSRIGLELAQAALTAAGARNTCYLPAPPDLAGFRVAARPRSPAASTGVVGSPAKPRTAPAARSWTVRMAKVASGGPPTVSSAPPVRGPRTMTNPPSLSATGAGRSCSPVHQELTAIYAPRSMPLDRKRGHRFDWGRASPRGIGREFTQVGSARNKRDSGSRQLRPQQGLPCNDRNKMCRSREKRPCAAPHRNTYRYTRARPMCNKSRP
jgi:hypothetical protein